MSEPYEDYDQDDFDWNDDYRDEEKDQESVCPVCGRKETKNNPIVQDPLGGGYMCSSCLDNLMWRRYIIDKFFIG